MFILTLLIQSELKNINDENKFLENTPCGIMLEELVKNKEIQEYLINVTKNIIELLEKKYSEEKINFEQKEIKDDWFFFGNKIVDKNSEKELKKNFDYFKNLDLNILKKLMEENKKDKDFFDYLNSKLSICKKDEKIFSNEKILEIFSNSEDPELLIILYDKSYSIVIEIIEAFIRNIIQNINIIPYSIRSLCKIISELVIERFPSISLYEKNNLIAKFFYGKLIKPFLLNSEIKNLYNENTSNNMIIICKILDKYFYGDFFTINDSEFYYTPFNYYFIEKIRNIFDIFKNISNIDVSPFFEKFINNIKNGSRNNNINNKLDLNYEYNYFKENQDEILNIRTILYNKKQMNVFIQNLKQNKNIIFAKDENIELKNAIENLFNNKNAIKIEKGIIDTTKENNNKKPEIKKEEINIGNIHKVEYFLITYLDLNEKYKELFNSDLKDFYPIKTDKNSKEKINRIKAKNFLCNLLLNYPNLERNNFKEKETNNLEKILKEMNVLIKELHHEFNDSSHIDWYIKSLLEYLKKLPRFLSKNDYEEFLYEIEKDINKSIKELNFEIFGIILEKLQNSYKKTLYYNNYIKFLEEFKINKEIKTIIKEYFIPVDIIFQFEKNEDDIFLINPSQFKEKNKANKEKQIKYETSNKVILCITIENFIKNFPNLVILQKMQDENILALQENLGFSKQINNYKEIIKKNLNNYNSVNTQNILNKIYDYIMDKLYDKIYPAELSEEYNKFFKKSVSLNWTKINHFLKLNQELDLGNFENDVLEYFKLLDKEKSPNKKINIINKIFDSISYLLKYNHKDSLKDNIDYEKGLLNYIMIKSQSSRIYDNIKFMEIYIGEKKNNKEGKYLKKMMDAYKFICQIINTDLNDVSAEKFNENCDEAVKKILE